MKNKYLLLTTFILIIIGIIIFLLFQNTKKDSGSPFTYSLDEFIQVDENLITYSEVKQINLSKELSLVDIAYSNQNIYLLNSNNYMVLSPKATVLRKVDIPQKPNRIAVSPDEKVYIVFDKFINTYNKKGELIKSGDIINDKSKFVSIDLGKDYIAIADAGQRKVILYDYELVKQKAFRGESIVSENHGFILPSLHFDLKFNSENQLWVANPGIHAIQNYSLNGKLIEWWSKASFNQDGFSGCCNPYYIEFLSNGNIITSEKGLVRIKEHKISGEFIGFVAPPKSFNQGKTAPAIAVSEDDIIITLDFDKNLIRFFEKH